MKDDDIIGWPDGKLTSAEYVLGLLSMRERRAVEGRLVDDRSLAMDIAFWEEKLVYIVDDVKSVTPPLIVWQRIEVALGTTALGQRNRLWDSVPFWRWSAITSATVAFGTLGTLVAIVVPKQSAPLMATLDVSGRARLIATIDQSHNTLIIVPASLPAVDRHSLQLWLIAPGDRPRSLGLVEPGGPARIKVPPYLVARVAAQAVLALSLEPLGGSPTGLPTGEVIAKGTLTSL